MAENQSELDRLLEQDEQVEYISVRVGKLPGRIEEVALNGGRSVEDALAAVELDFTGYEYSRPGSTCYPGD